MNRRGAEVAEGGKREIGAGLNHLTHGVIGAAIEVHRILGPGLLETIYERALCVELELLGIPFIRQVPVSVKYKDHSIGEARLELLVSDEVIVELKAASDIAPIHVAQLLSYLKLARLRLGLLINFNVSELRTGVKRVIYTP